MSGDPTSPVSPLASFPPDPPPEHRSRAPEFYGFAVLTSTYILFCIYLLWALLPDEYILWLGISYYPSREWAVLLPAYSIVLVLLTYFTYFALAIAGTPRFSEQCTITDSKAHYPGMDAPNAYIPANPGAIPDMYDIPIGMVNRALHGPRGQYRQDARQHASSGRASG
ncbi:PIG-P-domain-containing protein [Gloeophyllum trabeum ATCC 11539]|uniref:PIG-P-domain-containing protein n=1 Tax=Gloeophyllum trabeum (strain ATCC 11539 / FP-39264 / Madison 617) TaxID=670483 RepID=S7PX64_GLOTA|nr:PIG-P-domain-containing protein [Gloeophyllum trabeum ATCC 11539]EPQ52083.1 PIG-P-domain-containing protein [Gloeophyllum trabeum ATCC 11539]